MTKLNCDLAHTHEPVTPHREDTPACLTKHTRAETGGWGGGQSASSALTVCFNSKWLLCLITTIHWTLTKNTHQSFSWTHILIMMTENLQKKVGSVLKIQSGCIFVGLISHRRMGSERSISFLPKPGLISLGWKTSTENHCVQISSLWEICYGESDQGNRRNQSRVSGSQLRSRSGRTHYRSLFDAQPSGLDMSGNKSSDNWQVTIISST